MVTDLASVSRHDVVRYRCDQANGEFPHGFSDRLTGAVEGTSSSHFLRQEHYFRSPNHLADALFYSQPTRNAEATIPVAVMSDGACYSSLVALWCG